MAETNGKNGGEPVRVKAPIAHFLEVYLDDTREGRVRSLAEYLRLIPGDKDGISREYARRAPERESADPGEDVFVVNAGSGIDDYRVTREIGTGALGPIFEAVDTRTDSRVAIRVLTGSGAASPALLARFLRDAAVVAEVEHPGVAYVVDTGQLSGIPYLVSEYVEGTSLREHLAVARSPGRVAIRLDTVAPGSQLSAASGQELFDADTLRVLVLMEDTARALHAVHEAGVTHKDLSPSSIVITPQGSAVLLDFGLAREGESGAVTDDGTILGNPTYMSPERFTRSLADLDCRADVWSLGVILYECLTLAHPFCGDTPQRVMRAVRAQPVPELFVARGARELGVVIGRALEKDRELRYATAAGLAEDLLRLRKGTLDQVATVRPAPKPQPVSPPEPEETPEPETIPEPPAEPGADSPSPQAADSVPHVRPEPARESVAGPQRETRRVRWALVVTLAALTLLVGSALFLALEKVAVSTDPPGARIIVDGIDTGLRTPAHLTRWTTLTSDVRLEHDVGPDEGGQSARPPAPPPDEIPAKGSGGAGQQEDPSEPERDQESGKEADATGGTGTTEPGKSPEPGAPDPEQQPGEAAATSMATKPPVKETPKPAVKELPKPSVKEAPKPLVERTGPRDGGGTLQVTGARPGVTMKLQPVEGGSTRTLVLPLAGSLSFAPGLYRAELSADGHFRRTRTFKIEPGETVTLNVGLQAIERAHISFSREDLRDVLHEDVDLDGSPELIAVTSGRAEEAGSFQIHVVSGRTGEHLWTHRLREFSRVSVCVLQRSESGTAKVLVLATGGDGKRARTHARIFSGVSGQLIGSWTRRGESWRSAFFADTDGDGRDELLGVWGSRLSVHRTDNGGRLWQVPVAMPPAASPAVADLDGDGSLEVIAPGSNGRLLVLAGRTGKQKEEFQLQREIAAGPLIILRQSEAIALLLDERGELFAVDPTDGEIRGDAVRLGRAAHLARTRTDLDLDGIPDPVAATSEGAIVALSGADLSQLWRTPGPGAAAGVFGRAFRDLDGDGHPDVLVTHRPGADPRRGGSLTAYSGRDGAILMQQWPGVSGILSLDLVDTSGTGRLEILAGTSGGASPASPPGLSLLRMRKGSELWRLEPGGRVAAAMATTRPGDAGRSRVVLCTVDGHVHAVSGRGGDPVWTATVGGAVVFAPALGALDDDTTEDVVVVTSDGHLHALSGQTGRPLWKVTSLKGPLLSGPVVADVTGDDRPEVVISARDGHVHVISAQGVELVRFASESENGQADFRAAPVVRDLNGDGTPEIVVGGVDGYVYAWSARDDGWHWRSQVGGAILTRVLVANVDGEAGVEVIARDEHRQLVVLSGADGRRIHAHPARGTESSEPDSAAVTWLVHDVDADGRVEVVTGHHDGYVRCVEPATGKREWEVRHAAGQPAGLALIGSSEKQGVRLVVAPRGGRSLLVVSGRNGEVLEMHPVPGGISADPTAHDLDGDGTPEILVATESGTVLALTPGGAPRIAPVRISEASRRMQDEIVVALVRAMDRPAPADLVTLALSLSRLERHDEALEAIVRAANQGHRSPRLGALRLLYGLRTGLGLDWNVLAACVRSGPEQFLQAITECLHLLESSRPGKYHGALIPLVSRINRPGARDLLAREAIRLLMGGRPERDQRGVFSEDPVGADLFTAFSAFSAIAEGTVENGEAQLAKVKTRTGQRFVSTWRALSDETKELLRVFRSTR